MWWKVDKMSTKYAQHIPKDHTCKGCGLGVGVVKFSVHFTYGKFYTRKLCTKCTLLNITGKYPEGISKAIKNYFESKEYRK